MRWRWRERMERCACMLIIYNQSTWLGYIDCVTISSYAFQNPYWVEGFSSWEATLAVPWSHDPFCSMCSHELGVLAQCRCAAVLCSASLCLLPIDIPQGLAQKLHSFMKNWMICDSVNTNLVKGVMFALSHVRVCVSFLCFHWEKMAFIELLKITCRWKLCQYVN